MMTFLGGILGLVLAGAAGWLLGSWLAFAIAVVPLVIVSALLGASFDMYEFQKRIIGKPEIIDDRVDELVRADKWREAARWLLHGARLVEQAAREPRPDREALRALAARWNALARACVQHDVDRNYEAFRAFLHARPDRDRR